MELKDQQLAKIMQSSKLEMPFVDFEERVMKQIQEIEQQKIATYSYKRNALFFFVLGTFFGFLLNYFLIQYLEELHVSHSLKSKLTLLSQLLYVVLILIFSDKMVQLYHMLRNKSKFMKELI